MNKQKKDCKCCDTTLYHFKCRFCGEEGWNASHRKEFCNKACKADLRNKKLFDQEREELASKENEYTKNKHMFLDKIIDYPGAPGGQAYIGLAKAPLMKNPSGHGFIGVKLQTVNRELIQCAECGDWMKTINYGHMRACSGLTSKEYKKKHGFNKDTALISDAHSVKMSKLAIERDAAAVLNSGSWGQERKRNTKKYSVEHQNLRGTCPKQLKERLYDFIHRFKIFPTTSTRNRGVIPSIGVYRQRFGNFNAALKAYGLPERRRFGRSTIFTFSDGVTFRVYSHDDYHILHQMMLEKCKEYSLYLKNKYTQ